MDYKDKGPEGEPKPDAARHIRRYYKKLEAERDNYTKLMISAENLLDNEGLSDPDRSHAMLYGPVIPDLWQYEADRSDALARFALLPIDLVSAWVDVSMDGANVKEWYARLATYVEGATRDHTEACYVVPADADEAALGCEKCTDCPRKHLSARLQHDIVNPDFTSVGYLLDPERMQRIARDKIDVAAKFKMISNEDYIVMTSKYSFDYGDAFTDVPEADQA